ncbi:MAG: acyl carrier protein [Nocardiaceae bacterium]|nr:acyl carrier protein [Nocardiaceae bacterium]
MHEAKIREILSTHGKLIVDVSTLASADNLYAAGMTSHASVNVMIALEDLFDMEFPDELMQRSTFESISTINQALVSLGVSG